MRALSLLISLSVLVASASAQSINAYLAERARQNVKAVTPTTALASFSGSKVFEVRGTAKGTVFFGESGTLMLELEGGQSVQVETGPLPSWLSTGSEIRLLATITKEHENSYVAAKFIAAIPESMMTSYERAHAPKPAPTGAITPPPSRGSRGSTTTSRGGTTRPQPAPLEGQLDPRGDWSVSAQEALPYYIAFIRKQNGRLSEAQATKIAEAIIGYSLKFEVDARLIVALIIAESSFNPNAHSGVGAMGLGQLMPETARSLGVSNAYDVTQNLYGTIRYISGHIDNYRTKSGDDFDSIVLALAAYNAGPGAVRRHGGVPPYRETQNYVRKVMAIYNQLCGND